MATTKKGMLKHDPIRDGYVAQAAKNRTQLLRTKVPPQRYIASELGYCKRRIWYRHMGYIPTMFSARGSDYGRDGNAHHDLVRTFMADMGGAEIALVERDKMGMLSIETFQEDVEVTHKGLHLVLHARVDGGFKVGRSKVMLEIKSIGNKAYYGYNNIWTSTLDPVEVYNHMLEEDRSFVYQCHLGMFATKTKLAALVLKGRDGSVMGLHSQRDPEQILGYVPIPWSDAIWTTILNRCATIEQAKRDRKPPRAEFLKSSKDCGYCPFLHLCHGADKRRKQKLVPAELHPQLGEVIHATQLTKVRNVSRH